MNPSLTNALLQLANAVNVGNVPDRSRWTLAWRHSQFRFGSVWQRNWPRRKINVQTLNLATLPAIPDNSALLVIAAPKVPLLAGEITIIKGYIQRGGNLLLLTDPDSKQLTDLQKLLGIKQPSSVIVDSSSKLYALTTPVFFCTRQRILSNTLSPRVFRPFTLYPVVAALEIDGKSWFLLSAELLSSTPKSWTETGAIEGKIRLMTIARRNRVRWFCLPPWPEISMKKPNNASLLSAMRLFIQCLYRQCRQSGYGG